MSNIDMWILWSLVAILVVSIVVNAIIEIRVRPKSMSRLFRIDHDENLRETLGIKREKWDLLDEKERWAVKDIHYSAKSNMVKTIFSDAVETGRSKDLGPWQGSCFGVNGDGKELRIDVSTWKPKEEWITDLVYKSCMMDIWAEKGTRWGFTVYRGKDCFELFLSWINGEAMHDWEILNVAKCCINMEYECRRRVLEKMEKYSLGWFDREEYIRRSNSMIGFYGVALRRRRVYDISPELCREVVEGQYDIFLDPEDYLRCRHCDIGLYDRGCFLQVEYYGSKG